MVLYQVWAAAGIVQRSNLQVSRIQNILDSRHLKIGPIGCPETSVGNYHYTLRNNPEERSYHLLCSGSLKSRKIESIRQVSVEH